MDLNHARLPFRHTRVFRLSRVAHGREHAEEVRRVLDEASISHRLVALPPAKHRSRTVCLALPYGAIRYATPSSFHVL